MLWIYVVDFFQIVTIVSLTIIVFRNAKAIRLNSASIRELADAINMMRPFG